MLKQLELRRDTSKFYWYPNYTNIYNINYIIFIKLFVIMGVWGTVTTVIQGHIQCKLQGMSAGPAHSAHCFNN